MTNPARKTKLKENKERILAVIKFSFEIVTLLSTLVSVWLVFLTLKEMQVERYNSYRPNLCCVEKTYLIELEPEERFGDYHNEATVLQNVNYGDNRDFAVELVNIGVGTMEDIRIIVEEDECHRAILEFNKSTEYSKIVHNDREMNIWGSDVVVFSDEMLWEFFVFNEEMKYPYLLPNAQESIEYKLPSILACLVNATIIELEEIGYDTVSEYVTIPEIQVIVEYTDVQGVHYREQAVIKTEIGWLFGYGITVTFTISPI